MNADFDAFRYPQRVQPGCQHQLGCRCATPYYLRPSSPTELLKEAALWGRRV